MDTTSVPDAMEGLTALLTAAAALLDPKPAVAMGWPTGGMAAEQLSVLGHVDNWTRTWDTTAPVEGTSPNQEESYTLTVRVRTFREDKDYAPSFNRLADIIAAVEEQIRGDYTFGGAVTYSDLTGGDVREGIAENGRELVAEWKITCTAFLTG